MGFLPLTTLVSEVQAGLLNRTDLTTDRYINALNFAQARISRGWDFNELKAYFTTQTGFTSQSFNDKFITLPSFSKHAHTVILIDGTNSRKLVMKPWRQFDKMWPMPEALGRSRPQVYTRWGQTLVIYPVPDAVYQVSMRITQFPRPFNFALAPSAVSDFEWKDDILVALACAYLWKSIGRPDKADDYLQEANVHFKEAVKQDSDEPDMEVNLDLDTQNLGKYWADPFVKFPP